MAKEKVTLKEIARSTGVSLATVHRAIHGKDGLNEETRKRILDEVKRCNYQLDEAASALKRNVRNVYVVLPKAQNEDRFYMKGIWDGIRRASQGMEQYRIQYHYIESEYQLSDMSAELEQVFDQYLEEMDGLITIADGEKAGIWLSRFTRMGKFCVLISSYTIYDDPKITTVKMDHKMCGKLAAEYMNYGLKTSHGEILACVGIQDAYSNRIYAESFSNQMREYGHNVQEVVGFGKAQIEASLELYLNTKQYDGIFFCNARNTFYVCCLLKEKGLGKDSIVIGTDIFPELEPFFEEGILNAVICQYQWEQGAQAVRIMHEYLTKTLVEQEDLILKPVLLMKANYRAFIEECS